MDLDTVTKNGLKALLDAGGQAVIATNTFGRLAKRGLARKLEGRTRYTVAAALTPKGEAEAKKLAAAAA